MEHKCPHCGADLPENAGFCPHCATDLHPRKKAKKPVPLLKKLLLGLLALAVLAAVGFGLWAAFAPKTYDGYGEVRYGDYQLLLTQSTDRYIPLPELTIPGEPEGQYRVPSRLFINDSTGNDVSDAFLAEMEEVSAAFIGQEDSPSPFQCSQPAYNEGAPECPLISLIDFTGESGTAELVWTFQMKNGDTIILRQRMNLAPVDSLHYYPEDWPMATIEELQALVEQIQAEVPLPTVVHLHLPPVAYEGGLTIDGRTINLYGSLGEHNMRTTFLGPVVYKPEKDPQGFIQYIDFQGSGTGTGLTVEADCHVEDCGFSGWDTGLLVGAEDWADPIGCLFEDNSVGFRFDSGGSYVNANRFEGNAFLRNGTAVELLRVPGAKTLYFDGCRFAGNVPIRLRNFRPSFQVYRMIANGGTPSLCRQGIRLLAAEAAAGGLVVLQRPQHPHMVVGMDGRSGFGVHGLQLCIHGRRAPGFQFCRQPGPQPG